jgi:hypothetical protein
VYYVRPSIFILNWLYDIEYRRDLSRFAVQFRHGLCARVDRHCILRAMPHA